MKRFAVAVSLVVVSAGAGFVAIHAQGDPFFDRSDTGQLVHVLPPPASIRVPFDTQPIDASPRPFTAVYPPSYGSGNLSDHGGPEIAGAAFQPVYWNGSVAYSTATSLGYATIQAQIAAFASAFPDNGNWNNSSTDDYEIVQQYGSSDFIAPTLGSNAGFVDGQATKSGISDSSIQSYLSSLFNAGTLVPSGSTLYGVYFPHGMKVRLTGGSSCSSFCGYHSHFSYGGTLIKYAVFPYPDCTGCSLSGKSVADMLTIVSSHEIREAVTDSLGTAWYDNSGYEADDKCAWHNLYQMTTGGFWVQPEYSNGGTVTASGFSATYPGPGCVVPNQ